MQAQLEPLGGALQLTELRNLLDVVLEQAVSGLRELAAQLPSKTDDARSAARCAAILCAALHDTPAVLSKLPPRSRLLASLLYRACHAKLGIVLRYLGAHQLRTHSGVQIDRLDVSSCELPICAAKRLVNSSPLLATRVVGCARRKQELLAYLHATRQRLLRLHVLAQWGNMAPAAAAVSRVLDAAARQGTAARDAADQLAMSHAHITAVQVGSPGPVLHGVAMYCTWYVQHVWRTFQVTQLCTDTGKWNPLPAGS
jgi:Mediator complex subunit MED14